MNADKLYYKAAECFKAKNFDAALKLVNKVKKISPNHKQAHIIELCIWHERENCVREVDVLKKLLPLLELPEEKNLTADALNFLGMDMAKLAQPDEAVKFLRMSARMSKNNSAACVEISNAILSANASENFSREDFNELYAEYKSYLSDIAPFERKFYAHEKIRVGFVSGDFYSHPVMGWCLPLVTRLDKNFFATYCYSTGKKFDDATDYIRNAVEVWRDISDLTDFDAAKLIRDDEIDILVDLSGHTSGNRLRAAAFKPASVQVSGIGYMNSTGLDCFDYFLSDVHCAGDETYFAEKLIHLPQTHICYTQPPENEILDAPCLRKGFVTFGSFNNFAKVTDTILAAWKEILDRVPKSRLVLKQKIFSTSDGRNFVGERLKNFGFDLNRVDMRGYSEDFLDEYNDIDVALDTFPYVGGVTTCEALWMGVPVVSLYGDRHGTRFGLSMLTNVGLEELAVATVDEYISRAVMLANDWDLLGLLRRNLRDMMKNSPLMDERNYVIAVEKFFLQAVDDLKEFAPPSKKDFLRKGVEFFNANEFVKAFDVLKKLSTQLPEDKFLSAQIFQWLGFTCDALALSKDAINFCRTAAALFGDNQKSCESMSNAIFIANASEDFSREDFNALYAEYKNYLSDIAPFERKFYAHEKIRVGFMSGDFWNHAVMRWCVNLILDIDKNFFATYCYSTGKKFDALTDYIRNAVDGWRDISDLTDFEAAKLIRDDEIDILVDLSGHTGNNRLRVAAFKPASVQISGIGYMNSTGLDCFDYFLSDVHCAGDETWFTEKLIRLPNSHVCYAPPAELEILSAPCLRKGFVTFGSFNNFAKVTDTILAAWKEILDRVPKSRLVLKQKIFSTSDGRNFVGERLKSFGFDLKRVDMRGYSEDFLDEYNDIDVALDTFPYVGGVTTCEALWMGVPVVSLYGDRHGTRFGLSMLTNVGLAELAVPTVDEYISRAVMLANDWDLLGLLRRNLRDMMKNSPLMDKAAYVRNVEKVFKQILVDVRPPVV